MPPNTTATPPMAMGGMSPPMSMGGMSPPMAMGGVSPPMSMGGMSPPMAMGGMKMGYTHMTFFWGKNSEILFTGWPGARGGHYALALIVCFFMALLVEWLSNFRPTKPGWSRGSVALTQTIVHTTQVGLAYLIMLAVMSFNGGVLIVVVAGYAVGFVLFGCSKSHHCQPSNSDLPPVKC